MKKNVSMVDITKKQPSFRTAVATGKIFFSKKVYTAIQKNTISKGDPIITAKIAGILASKNVAHTIPLTHPINITNCDIQIKNQSTGQRTKIKTFIEVTTTVKIDGKTGPDIEAMYATMIALLTIYDMIKPIDPGAVISDIKLISKTGGKSNFEIFSPMKH